jgi:hypothetical protein
MLPTMTTTNTATRQPFRTITIDAAARQGLTPRRITAEALHAWLPVDGSTTALWDRIGNVHGVIEYGLSHFRRYENGVEIVRLDGSPVLRYPLGQGRYVRILGNAS